jgi:hypothetical protein
MGVKRGFSLSKRFKFVWAGSTMLGLLGSGQAFPAGNILF